MNYLSNAVFPNAGELYFFSDNDSLCLADGVELFIKEREKNVDVCIRVFLKDSAHCQHMRKYSDIYWERCKELHYRAVNKWCLSHGLPAWKVPARCSAL
jgi:hypothetical protein